MSVTSSATRPVQQAPLLKPQDQPKFGMLGLTNSYWPETFLSQSTNLSYIGRGVVRGTSVVPSDRKMDYLFRDPYMTLVSAVLFESGVRLGESFLIFPQMAEFMEMNRLTDVYSNPNIVLPNNVKRSAIKNYDGLPENLREWFGGNFNNDRSNYSLGDMIEKVVIPELEDKNKGNKAAVQSEIDELRFLAYHMRRKFNPQAHVDNIFKYELKDLPQPERHTFDTALNTVKNQFSQVDKIVADAFDGKLGELPKNYDDKIRLITQQISESLSATPVNIDEKELKESLKTLEVPALYFKDAYEHAKTAIMTTVGATLEDPRLAKLAEDFVDGQILAKNMGRLGKFADWPRTFLSAVLTFAVYGMIASQFDVNVLQPYQEKLSKKYGNVSFTVDPFLMGMIPAGVAFWGAREATQRIPQLAKLGHMGKLLATSAIGMAAYTGIVVGWSRHRMQKLDQQLLQREELNKTHFNKQDSAFQQFKTFKTIA